MPKDSRIFAICQMVPKWVIGDGMLKFWNRVIDGDI